MIQTLQIFGGCTPQSYCADLDRQVIIDFQRVTFEAQREYELCNEVTLVKEHSD